MPPKSWVASNAPVMKFPKCGLPFLYLKNWLRYWEISLKLKVLNKTKVVFSPTIFMIQRRGINFKNWTTFFYMFFWQQLTLRKSNTNCKSRVQCLTYCMTPHPENYIKPWLWYIHSIIYPWLVLSSKLNTQNTYWTKICEDLSLFFPLCFIIFLTIL